MTQTVSQLMSFDEFLDWKPENGRYELHRGGVIEMPNPAGKHSEIAGFLAAELNFENRRLQLPYRFPKNALVKSPYEQTGYFPDVLAVNRDSLVTEPLWEKSSTITQGSSIPLIIEVVSTNWRDDYAHKMIDYEALGIFEYWIVDYLGLGGSRYIGSPKQPTLSVYQLIDGEYQIKLFRGDEQIESLVFPELNLTAQQIFNGGR